MVIASGGSPTVEKNVFEDTGYAYEGATASADGSSIVATAGTTVTIVGNILRNGGPIAAFRDANPSIDGNRLEGGPHIYLNGAGPDTVVQGNTILGTRSRAIAVASPGSIVVEGNSISDYGLNGIRIGRNGGAAGYETQVRNNIIEGTGVGISVTQGGEPRIEGNTLSGNDQGVSLVGGVATLSGNTLAGNRLGLSLGSGNHTVAGNTITDGSVGIIITGGEAQLTENVVEGASGRGIAIGGTSSSPTLVGNRSCGNGENLWVSPDATAQIDESNEICEDAPA